MGHLIVQMFQLSYPIGIIILGIIGFVMNLIIVHIIRLIGLLMLMLWWLILLTH